MILSEQTFIELAGKQEVLDAKIKAANGVEKLPTDRIELYYYIELGECLNELKGDFKHWSKKPMNREAFIEELVDALHFYLSYANHFDKEMDGHLTINTVYKWVKEQYDSYKWDGADLWEMARAALRQDIERSFGILLAIAERYDFTEQDIIDAYNKKNDTNHDRSDSGVY
ncbi:dUTP diphosphatase [Exiguobacterium sp. PBE]|nr:dUTP diphosphatase [Exiguobacterium sp. PBE]